MTDTTINRNPVYHDNVAAHSEEQQPVENRRSINFCSICGDWFKPVESQPKFVCVKEQVLQGQRVIARAISKTMAKRIANALNEHKVNREGV